MNTQAVTAYHCACGDEVEFERLQLLNYLYYGLIGKYLETPHDAIYA